MVPNQCSSVISENAADAPSVSWHDSWRKPGVLGRTDFGEGTEPMAASASSDHYDAVVIGSGQGGGPLATAFARAGRRAAIVERAHVGGTCVNVGCTPTKTMIASARVAYLARRGDDYGVRAGEVAVDLARVRERKRAIVDQFRSGSERQTRETPGLDLIMGEASFTGPRSLDVALAGGGERSLTADLVVIDTGARPAAPQLDGIESVPYLTSTTAMELADLPDRLIVLGGGYVGIEFGQMFRRFGSRVTIVQRGGRLLSREDDDVAEAVAAILREDGIEILTHATAKRVHLHADRIVLTIETGGGERTIAGSHLLAAAGRVPNTDALNLAAAGVETDDRGYVRVDDRLTTNVPGVYAIGDVTGQPAHTHVSYDDFRILRTNLLEGGNVTTTGRLIPYTVFMDPQLGRVGLTERAAREQGRRFRLACLPMSQVARAREVDETRGFMKAIVDADTDLILGCAILGLEGGELMSMIEIAMMGQVTASRLRDAVLAHPTLAESLNNLFTALQD
jgi:pyruvate/2-oxoglutarate dehydrogenase complex dihydrolipoamide dehydrogenase (E3) component